MIRTGGLYAAGAIALGLATLAFGDFLLQWQPVPADWPVRPALAILSGLVLIVAGAAVFVRRAARPAAWTLAGVYGLWVLALHLPRVVAAPTNVARWLGVAEIGALAAAGLLLAVSERADHRANRLRNVGRVAFGLCPLVFGLSHLVYPEVTASLVPAWIPPGQAFWAYATGGFHLAAGLAILANVQAGAAAGLLALMCLGFVLLLHLPRVVVDPSSRVEWTMLAVALSLTGAAFVLFRATPPTRSQIDERPPRA